MRRNRYAALPALAALLAAVALLPGCPAIIGAGALGAFTSLEDRRTTGTQIEDQGIESRTATRIADRFPEQAHVNVAVFNRMVLLTGEAWDEATRDGDRQDRRRGAECAHGGQRGPGFGVVLGRIARE